MKYRFKSHLRCLSASTTTWLRHSRRITSNQPLDEWILPRTFRRCEHFVDAHSVNPVSEVAP